MMTVEWPHAVIVVGGTSGVGKETAAAFAEAKASSIVLVGRDADRGAAAVADIEARTSFRCDFVATDVMDSAAVLRMVEQVRQRHGGVSALVNSYTSAHVPSLFHQMDIDGLGAVITDQMSGVLHTCRAVLPVMRAAGSGTIVNISSDAGKVPTVGESVLGAAMAAIVMFGRTLALEAKRDGIRVNTVTPSLIADTGGYARTMADPFSARLFEKALSMASLGITEPQDLAELIVFLSSERARRITGQAVSVNGGIST